jgi:hypothetical protein
MSVTWCMRYRFRLAKQLSAEGEAIELQLGGRPVTLKSRMGGLLRDARFLVLLTKGFETDTEARAFGDRVRHALLTAAVRAKIGVDLGEDTPTSRAAPLVKKRALEEQGVALLDDVHGLMVYPDSPAPHVLSVEGKGTVLASPSPFLSALAEAFDDGVILPEELEIPVELYCASCMEPSPIAQLIVAVAAIEALVGERPPRPEVELELVDRAGKAVKQAKASKSSRDAVLGSLGNLRKVGIRRAGQELVDLHLPGEGAGFIEVYDYRGRIAHRHERPDRASAAAMAHKAQRLASELIAKLTPTTSPC